MDHVRFCVIGAGVTGLSFAGRIASDDVCVLEADSEPGGYCKTIREAGFVWDYSGHFFHFKHPEIEQELVARMGDQRVLKIARDSRIFWQGDTIDFPFQKNIHQLPRADFLDCLVDLHFREGGEPANFEDMLVRRFGRAIADRFLIPYNEKLYATDLSRLDADAMGRFFPHADEDAIIRNFRQADNASYNATFTYPEGGAIQYIHALMAGVPDGCVHLDEPVTAIDVARKVVTTPRREIAYEALLSSMPFDRLLRMTGLAHDPATFTSNKVLVFNLGFDRKGPEGVHWMYFPQRDLCFYRVGFYDNIFGSDRMSLYVEIGMPSGAALSEADIDAARASVVADLARCGLVDGHQLVAHHHVVLDPAYVHITADSNAEVARLKASLATRGVYSAGRYGSWTYCSIEDNIVEARELADRFNEGDAAAPT